VAKYAKSARVTAANGNALSAVLVPKNGDGNTITSPSSGHIKTQSDVAGDAKQMRKSKHASVVKQRVFI
jgi:hypothetical protein